MWVSSAHIYTRISRRVHFLEFNAHHVLVWACFVSTKMIRTIHIIINSPLKDYSLNKWAWSEIKKYVKKSNLSKKKYAIEVSNHICRPFFLEQVCFLRLSIKIGSGWIFYRIYKIHKNTDAFEIVRCVWISHIRILWAHIHRTHPCHMFGAYIARDPFFFFYETGVLVQW